MRAYRKPVTLLVGASLLTLAFLGRPAAQQTGMPGWVGRIGVRWTYSGSDSEKLGAGERTVTREQRYEAVYTLTPNGALAFDGLYSVSEVRKDPTTTVTYEEQGRLSKQVNKDWVGFSSRPDGSYSLTLSHPAMPGGTAVVTTRDHRGTRTASVRPVGKPSLFTQGASSVEAKADRDWASLPGTVTLSGSVTRALHRGKEPAGEITYAWNLTHHENLEVIVEPKEYDGWVPQGGPDENTPGNRLVVEARLQTKDGSPVREEAAKFTFQLAHVSREPGVCMNFPANPKEKPDPDLQFDEQSGAGLTVFDDKGRPANRGPRAETKRGRYKKAQASVGAYDWGAWGEIRVTAEMPDGRKIVGYLEKDKDRPYVLLPRRQPGSHIADAWKEGLAQACPGIRDLPDDDDSEDVPKQTGAPGLYVTGPVQGDGLTLYEEYRGFYEGGGDGRRRHVQGDPARKDVFIWDTYGGPSKDGILLFQALSGLAVHHELGDDEIGPGRVVTFGQAVKEGPPGKEGPPADQTGPEVVVNSNYSAETPRRGTKYGIYLASAPTDGPDGIGYGGPGQPKKVVIRYTDHLLSIHRLSYTVAHELLHCCNVAHHGNTDRGFVQWTLNGDTIWEELLDQGGVPSGRPIRVRIRLEGQPGDLRPDQVPGQLMNCTIYVARQHGQHSGYQDCVMRYCLADAYQPEGEFNTRVLVPLGEHEGRGLCNTREDSAVAAQSLPPLGRYGQAANGLCLSQICVNDAAARALPRNPGAPP
jgi:hypothetical protein